MKVKIDGYTVYNSGSLIVAGSNNVSFNFDNDDHQVFDHIHVEFVGSIEGNKFAEIEEKKTLKLKIPKNVHYLPKNVKIGLLGEKELYFNYHLTTLKENYYIFGYIFLIKN